MENKVKYKERKKLSIVLEKLIVSTTKVLLVIVTFLFLSTVYKYTFSRTFGFSNSFTLKGDVLSYDTIKENIDKISKLEGNGKYSKEEINQITKFLDSSYSYITTIAKIEECTSCNYSEYFKKARKILKITNRSPIIYEADVFSIFKGKNEDLRNETIAFFFSTSDGIELSEHIPYAEYGYDMNYMNEIYYYPKYRSYALYYHFYELTEDIYEEVSIHE